MKRNIYEGKGKWLNINQIIIF